MLEWIASEFHELLASIRREPADVLGIESGATSPDRLRIGARRRAIADDRVEDFDIRGWLNNRIDAPVTVENEVNLMAISEHHRFWPNVEHLFFVKAGTGIGSGVIANGRIYRGARGAAGEIGHIQVEVRGRTLMSLRDVGLP